MSMRINEGSSYSRAGYAEEVKEKQAAQRAKKAEAAKEDAGASAPHDEYISSKKSGAKPSGLYRVGQDEKGGRKIFYDDPKKSAQADEKIRSETEGAGQGKPAEECTTDTGKVDREIRKLKEKKQQLQQQIRAASGEEGKVRELERKLAQVESELSRKDNDTYRRQNASVSE